MTFAPVLPPLVLLVIAVVVIALRLLNMRRLHAVRRGAVGDGMALVRFDARRPADPHRRYPTRHRKR